MGFSMGFSMISPPRFPPGFPNLSGPVGSRSVPIRASGGSALVDFPDDAGTCEDGWLPALGNDTLKLPGGCQLGMGVSHGNWKVWMLHQGKFD